MKAKRRCMHGKRRKRSPMRNESDSFLSTTRKDSTVTFDADTLEVDSTPVGQRKTKAVGYGWNAAIKSGPGEGSMWKSARDKKATEEVEASNRIKSSESKRGVGGQRPMDPSQM